MAIISFNADATTLILNGKAISDFPEGDFLELNGVNPLTHRTNGANDSVNITKRIDSEVADLVLRVMRYSDADIWLTNQRDSDEIVVLSGSIKESFIRDGQKLSESFELVGGSFTDPVNHKKSNQEREQAVEYKIQFRAAKRNI